jgi:hypothetical protein
MKDRRWPRTDIGTVVFHWLAVASVAVLLLTGLRFSSDDIHNIWLRTFDQVLASEDVWYRHMIAGYGFTFVAAGYSVYMLKARLFDRIRLNSTRMKDLFGSSQKRWASINVISCWAFLIAAIGACTTGWLAYFGASAQVLYLHRLCTWVIIGFPALHILALAKMGGLAQLSRILRPKHVEPPAAEIDLVEVVADLLEEKRARQNASQRAHGTT